MKEETTPTAGLQADDIKRITTLIRALYHTQRVFMPTHAENGEEIPVQSCHLDFWFQNKEPRMRGYLLLRPLSSITDDEAVRIAKIIYPADSAKDLWTAENGKDYLNYLPNVMSILTTIWQCLNQMGFAVDYYDSVTNTTITVEQQIEHGIIKLKS